MPTLKVNTNPPYDIFFCHEALESYLIEQLPADKKIALLCDERVRRLYQPLVARLQAGIISESALFEVPSGEKFKTRATKDLLEDKLLAAGFLRDSVFVAIGGGVTCDLVGFVAATYCRGVPVVYVPTTLLAMVDASVGGKTAVNTSQGKNLVGVFKQPQAVFIDSQFLATLAYEQRVEGLAELLKHGLIKDEALFYTITNNWAYWLCCDDGQELLPFIEQSCALKAAIVASDPRDQGVRVVLNLGHTIAHAIERASDYAIPHGIAVLVGLYVEALLADLPTIAAQLEGVLKETSLDWELMLKTLTEPERVIEALSRDKKNSNGRVNFVNFVLLDQKRFELENFDIWLCQYENQKLEQALIQFSKLLSKAAPCFC